MKKLGLIGGMGPESTREYYKRLHEGFQKAAGRPEIFPFMTVESVNYYEMIDYCTRKDVAGLTEFLLQAVRNVTAAGAEFAALSANTPHLVFDTLRDRSTVPLVSIVECAVRAVSEQGMKRVGLLGTIFTMREDFFKKPFRKAGIEVVCPSEEGMVRLNRHIAEELELGFFLESTRNYMLNVIENMRRTSAIEGVILGCTELPLLLKPEDISIPSFDTMDIHVAELLRLMTA